MRAELALPKAKKSEGMDWKAQSAAIGIVVLVVVAVLGIYMIAKTKASLPDDLDATTNASVHGFAEDLIDNYELFSLVVFVVLAALVLKTLMGIGQ